MRITIHEDDRNRPAAGVEEMSADCDFRGPYGYGRRAYSPDPAAHYEFRPGPARTLPAEQRRRWRVPG